MSGLTGRKGFGVLGLLSVAVLALVGRSASPRKSKEPLNEAFIRATQALDRKIGWDRLPLPLGLAVLIGNRMLLRQRNLHDTSVGLPPELPPPEPDGARHLTARTADGSFNDLAHPNMGRAGARFGRNVPLEHTHPQSEPDILRPNPRTVSRRLMTRDEFQPATTVNVLVAAWIQFMVRDWLSHGQGDIDNPWRLPAEQGDTWERDHGGPLVIPRTRRDPTWTPGSRQPPTYINAETHWWDGSQIYGSSKQAQAAVRSGEGGKLRVEDGLIPRDILTQVTEQPGSWVGLVMLQTLFALEHNAICDRLRAEYPTWSDDDLFDHARLVNSALLAKIHTVEWTPAIISHPTTQYSLKANWWGVEMERLHRLLGRLADSEVVSGIPGSPTDHHTAPYAITEEFVAVYRMHPLLPDDYVFRSAASDQVLQERTFPELTDRKLLEVLEQVSLTDLYYSFGIAHPGAVVLHNYPRGLQEFRRPDGKFMDLAATDILRIRELGVPRYNQFRRLLHLAPAESFEALTDNPRWARELREVYDDDIESVDLMSGMFAERRPQGFGFSDTAFRIFILMASRRLKSDRFFTTDFTPAVYTQAGLDWIADNTMATVLRRHYPGLGPRLRQVDNAFEPWPRATA